MSETSGSRGVPTVAHRVAPLVVIASFAFFFERLWSFVSRNAVDVPYRDLWDLLDPFFRGESLWSAVMRPHGTVLQGLGAPLIAATNAVSRWDMRVLSLESVVILLGAALLALELKVRLFGRLTLADALIPALFFRLVQGSAIARVPYAACVPIPVMFAVLGARLLLIRNGRVRVIALALFSLVATATGFSMFVPPALVVALLLRALFNRRADARGEAAANLREALIVLLGMLPAVVGLRRNSFAQLACPGATPTVVDYVTYVLTMITGSFGVFDRSRAMLGVAAVLVVPLLALVVVALWRAARADADGLQGSRAACALVPVVLIGFSLLFSIASAMGRICADGAALNSRYLALMSPLGLGLYFALLGWTPAGGNARRLRIAGVWAFALATMFGAMRISAFDADLVEASVTGKLRWIECVRGGGTAAECNQRAQFAIYPAGASSRLDEKIEFLRSRRLSFFAERDPGPSDP